MLQITVCNREEAERTIIPEATGVISISTPGDDPATIDVDPSRVLRLEFDDVDKATGGQGSYEGLERNIQPITAEQADALATFVTHSVKAGISSFLVHCDAGISRSPGVLVALEEVFNDNKQVAKLYPLHNRLVARRVLEALLRLGDGT